MKPKKRSLIVGNTKLVTARTSDDVSVMQAYLSMRIMKNFITDRFGVVKKGKRATPNDFRELLDSVGVIFAGDLNRLPTDELYKFFSQGSLSPEYIKKTFGRKVPDRPVAHEFHGLKSAYSAALGKEPILTSRLGCLDYIWFSGTSLLPRSVLPTPMSMSNSGISVSNPSDHVPLKATFSFIDPGPAAAENAFSPENRPAPVADPVGQSVQLLMKKAAATEPKPQPKDPNYVPTPRRPVKTFFDRKETKRLAQRRDADDEADNQQDTMTPPPLPTRSFKK